MTKIAALRSPGVNLAALVLTVALPAGAQTATFADGASAFAARDYMQAEALWAREAATGSAEAELGLGNLADMGVTAPRDADAALRHYRIAAEGGIAAAAFNVGALIEAEGLADPYPAAFWYACAAAGSHRRAEFALGQLFATGSGVQQNLALARRLFEGASSALPAAKDAANDLANERPGALSAPEPIGSQRFLPDVNQACLAWDVSPLPDGAIFRVEVLAPGEAITHFVETDMPSVIMNLPEGQGELAWRVSAIDPDTGRAAASRWLRVSGGSGPTPAGGVSFRMNAGDQRALDLAQRVGKAIEDDGVDVSYDVLDDGQERVSSVRYSDPTDASLAAEIAALLPGANTATQRPPTGFAPRNVVVTLVFDD